MTEPKHWTESKTIRALAVAGLCTLLAIVGAIWPASGLLPVALTVLVPSLLAAGGFRASATQPLTRQRPPGPPPLQARPRQTPPQRAARRGMTSIAGVLLVALTLAACASSPEQREARRAHAVETAATLSECAVSQAVGGCALQLAELVGCAVRSEPSCAVPRRQWAMCMAAQATGCGLAALVSVVHGAAEGPQITMIDPCGVDAAEDCVAWADQPDRLRECYGGRLVRCVE